MEVKGLCTRELQILCSAASSCPDWILTCQWRGLTFKYNHSLIERSSTKDKKTLTRWPRLWQRVHYLINAFLTRRFISDCRSRCWGLVGSCFPRLSDSFCWKICIRLFGLCRWAVFVVAGIGLRDAFWWHLLIREQLRIRVDCTSLKSSSSSDIILKWDRKKLVIVVLQ
jgi:hypothetical protein